MAKPLVPDALWDRIAPLIPLERPKPQGGRPRVDDRAALTGILFVLKTGIGWEYLPQEMGCGSGMTCWRRLRDWQLAGEWERLHLHRAANILHAARRLAQIAASGPSLVPVPGQYLYVDSQNDYSGTAVSGQQECVTRATDHRQVWIGANGSGLLRDTTGPTMVTSAGDRALCLSMKPSPLTPSGTSNLWFAADCFQLGPTNDMQSLSTDPATLLAQMRQIDGGPPGPAEDFVHVGDFLRETDASPALRAALYRAALMIPGVKLLGTVRDHLGRAGVGVAYEGSGVRHELIFNPRTAALMGEQDAGTIAAQDDWAVYLQSRLVNRLPEPAPVPLTPPCVNGGGSVTHTPHGDVQTGANSGG